MTARFLDATQTLVTTADTVYVASVPSGGPGLAVGDVLIVQAQYNATLGTITTPAGWLTWIAPTYVSSSAIAVYAYVITAPDLSTTTYTFTMSAAVLGNLITSRFRGIDPVTPLDAALQSVGNSTATKTVPSLTTVTNKALIVGGGTLQSATANQISLPTGWAIIKDTNHLTAGRGGIFGHNGNQSPAGAIPAAVFTQDIALAGTAWQAALRPLPSTYHPAPVNWRPPVDVTPERNAQ